MALPARTRRRHRLPAATALALAALLLCAACSKPEPPETDRPPEPQADAMQADAADATDDTAVDATQPAGASDATELRDTMQQPIDRARAVQGEVDAGAAKQRADVDAQTGY